MSEQGRLGMLKRVRAHARSNAIAYVALFFAVAGAGAYAADKIGSGDIKRNAVKSRHIGANQVKGADVDESTLRRVPATGFQFIRSAVTAKTTLLSLGGLQISAQCDDAGGGDRDLRVFLRNTAADESARIGLQTTLVGDPVPKTQTGELASGQEAEFTEFGANAVGQINYSGAEGGQVAVNAHSTEGPGVCFLGGVATHAP